MHSIYSIQISRNSEARYDRNEELESSISQMFCCEKEGKCGNDKEPGILSYPGLLPHSTINIFEYLISCADEYLDKNIIQL